jgi:hypothetical protein
MGTPRPAMESIAAETGVAQPWPQNNTAAHASTAGMRCPRRFCKPKKAQATPQSGIREISFDMLIFPFLTESHRSRTSCVQRLRPHLYVAYRR